MSVCHTKGVLQPLVRKRTIGLEPDRNHPGFSNRTQVITVGSVREPRILYQVIIEILKQCNAVHERTIFT